MKKINNKGFTMIELLAVLVLISLVFTIAMPGLLKMRDKMYDRALNHKKDIITKAAILYVQDNSNWIKNIFNSSQFCNNLKKDQTNNNIKCTCNDEDDTDCKYEFYIAVNKLLEKGYIEEDTDCNTLNNATVCVKSSNNGKIKILLDDNYKTVTAEFKGTCSPPSCLNVINLG